MGESCIALNGVNFVVLYATTHEAVVSLDKVVCHDYFSVYLTFVKE